MIYIVAPFIFKSTIALLEFLKNWWREWNSVVLVFLIKKEAIPDWPHQQVTLHFLWPSCSVRSWLLGQVAMVSREMMMSQWPVRPVCMVPWVALDMDLQHELVTGCQTEGMDIFCPLAREGRCVHTPGCWPLTSTTSLTSLILTLTYLWNSEFPALRLYIFEDGNV